MKGPWAAILPLACLGMASCVNINPGSTGLHKVFVGAVKVTVPKRSEGIVAVDVRTLGAGWNEGPFIGWQAGSWISADPGKCQLVVVIRSALEADNASRVLQSLKGQDVCIADLSGSLHR